MGFRSNKSLKMQLGTWHGRATGSTGCATTLGKAAKGSQRIEHGRAKLLALAIDLKLLWLGYFLHRIFIFSAPNIILDPFLLKSSLKPFFFRKNQSFHKFVPEI